MFCLISSLLKHLLQSFKTFYDLGGGVGMFSLSCPCSLRIKHFLSENFICPSDKSLEKADQEK